MNRHSKLMEMLTGYAAAHQHPTNITVHMIGIPVIMFGAFIPLTWATVAINDAGMNVAQITVVLMFLFYLTLDILFALVFLAVGFTIAWLAAAVGSLPFAWSGSIAAACFGGGYLAQFVGHAIEKSKPVVLTHPIQAQLAAPFFTVVEGFKLLGLRDRLFREVQQQVEARRGA